MLKWSESIGTNLALENGIDILMSTNSMVWTRNISRFYYLLLILALGEVFSENTVEKLPQEIHTNALQCISAVYREEFKEAKQIAKNIIKKHSENPAGYFFYAVVLNYELEYLQSEKHENEFYSYCDLAISYGEKQLENNPKDKWAQFFIAGANGAKGKYEARYGKWITAFKHGWAGVVIFKKLRKKNNNMRDVIYGIATYDYWRSAKTKMMWWLPGVEDKRGISIDSLYVMKKEGVYVKESASMDLMDILYNEKRYAEVIEVADTLIGLYPKNLKCHWEKAKALLAIEKYDESRELLLKILDRIINVPFDNSPHMVLCHYYLLKIYFNTQKFQQCIEMYETIASTKISELTEKRFEDELNDASDLLRKAKRALSKR